MKIGVKITLSLSLQRCVQQIVGAMACVSGAFATVRRAGQAQAVTRDCVTHSVWNMGPAGMASASVNRAGTENTAPSVNKHMISSCFEALS